MSRELKRIKMKLLQNEEKLQSSNADKIVLTNQRILMQEEVWGKSYKISIFLEDISSIETHFKSNTLFLIIGIILAVAGLLLNSTGIKDTSAIGLIIGGIFIALWWFSRKHLVTIASNGGSSLNVFVQQMSEEKIEELVTIVQEAKLKRVNELFKI